MSDAPTPPPRGWLAGIVQFPSQLLLWIASAGVFVSLAVASVTVWLASLFGPSRRR